MGTELGESGRRGESWSATAEVAGLGVRAEDRWREIRTLGANGVRTSLPDGRQVVQFASNDYLGLSGHPSVIAASVAATEQWGTGSGASRLVVGSRPVHDELEAALAEWKHSEAALLFASGYAANVGVVGALTRLGEAPGRPIAVVSDALNHASIIDGIRLSKAQRFRYQNGDMAELEQHLKASMNCRSRLIATDGVFSMDGFIAKLPQICDLADKYQAMVMVDDSHATGFFGPTGRGTPEFHGVQKRIDVMTSTLGKALGGAAGGFTTGKKEIIDLLRNRSRPYLFSNTLAPAIVGSTIACLDKLSATTALRDKLAANTKFFREAMTKAGFAIVPGEHPICPIMLGEAKLAVEMAAKLLQEGVYVIGFCFPVVPKGKARIRVQISAAHERAQLEFAVAAFAKVGKQLGVIS